MPQALDVDYSHAKLIYASTGSYREASDQTGIPYDAVRQRGCREGWPVQVKEAAELVSHRVTEAIGTAYLSREERSKRVRDQHIRAAEKVADKLAEMDPDELFMSAPLLLQHGKHAALACAWETNIVHTMSLEAIAGTIVNQDTLPDCPEIEQNGP